MSIKVTTGADGEPTFTASKDEPSREELERMNQFSEYVVKLKTDDAFTEVMVELQRARTKHPTPMRSPHEGIGILLEEVYELWKEVCEQKHNTFRLRRESCQVAAMAVRFMSDVAFLDGGKPAIEKKEK